MRVKIVQAGVPNDDIAEVSLSLRAQAEAGDGCESYDFSLSTTNNSATIFRSGPGADCNQAMLVIGSLNLETGEWHDVRAEVNDEQLSLFVDNTHVLSASDTALTQGFFYVT